MRVLYHHRTLAEDGQAVHIRELQRALALDGHDVREVALVPQGGGRSRPGGELRKRKARARWRWVLTLPTWIRELAEYGYAPVARRQVVRAGRQHGSQFIYERYSFGNSGGLRAARVLGVPHALEVNSPLAAELERTRGLHWPWLAHRWERAMLRSSDRVFVVTEVLRRMLIAQGVREDRIRVLHNGVDPQTYNYANRAEVREAARRQLGLREGVTALGFVGFFRAWHRLDIAVRSLAEPGLEGTHLVLLGDGGDRGRLAALAQRHGCADRLTIRGPFGHQEIAALLPALDVALIPGIPEYASPLKLHEYMAAALPVVAPNQANLRELLVDGQNAILFEPQSLVGFAGAVRQLIVDADLRARLATAGSATIARCDLSWTRNARAVVRELAPLAGANWVTTPRSEGR